MFKKNKTNTSLTFIAQGTRFTGESAIIGDALIGGELFGKVNSKGTITVEAGGLLEGEVRCKELKVAGAFKGKLSCDKLMITVTGTVEGEVASKSMEITDGGQFIGMRVKDDVMLLEAQTEPEA
ncbi:bactofilin family protein [Shewanella gelidii]|uniref:DUF583 domain-containing protein n=1 Tax=Shewanella gelidii TaxID=1642821 RepID=A0A917JJH8_9GAMM|nr:polymer-forming cytoskeletal protein [Shewanella gelidii]MCL1096382.1 polymer-forming cytoskeletal protein [Shewanella gelidii]GGI67107.1 DUF583 domain-containing protein [Shewanella gelidii]